MKKIQVSYLGLNSLFGRVTTNLLKQSPCIEKLSIYDDDDASILEGETGVFIGRDQLPDAVKDVNIVVIGDESCDTHEEDRLKVIGPKIIRYTEAILTSSPNAIIVVAASPLNILVPLVGHFLGPDWQNRLLGITSVDTLRASRILNGLLNNPQEAHILPVVGGSSVSSRVPLFSHLHPKILIRKDIREQIMEKMKLFDDSKYREMDSVERAYIAVRFIHSIISGMLKDSPIPEIAMTKTTEVPNAQYFSLPMLLGKNGIENAMQLPKFDEVEEKLFLEATERLAEDARKARDFINSLAQESVRNVNKNRDINVGKSLTWNQSSESSNDSNLQGEESTVGGALRETQNTAEMASMTIKSLIVKREIREVNSEDNNRPFTYRSLAKPCGSQEARDVQKSNRKSIPMGPAYQLVPEPKWINRDSVKLVESGKPKTDSSRNNKDDEPTDGATTLSSAEEVSSRGSDAWRSPTRTALETSNRIETLVEHDVPQPSSIQNLVPEIIQLGSTSKTDSHSQKQEQIERRPSLKDSDISSPDSDCTETLMKEVNDHLGDISKYSSSSPTIENPKDGIVCREFKQLIDKRLLSVEDHGSYNKQRVCSESTPLAISSYNNETSSYNSSQNNVKSEVNILVVSPRPHEVERTTFSHLSDNQKFSKNELVPNYESTPEYFNRDRTMLTKKCDKEKHLAINSEILNGKKKDTREPKIECEPGSTQHQTKYHQDGEPNASSLKTCVGNNDIPTSLNEKFKLENKQIINLDSEEMVRKRWKEKLFDETMWASSTDVIDFNRRKKNSVEWSGTSVDVKQMLKSRRPISSNEGPDQNTKDRYPIGFPGIRLSSRKPDDAKTFASEDRILCLMENSLRKNSLNNSVESVPPKKQEKAGKQGLKLETLSTKPSIPQEGLSKSEILLRSKLKANSSSGTPLLPGVSFNRRIVKDLRWSTNDDDCVSANLLAAKGRDTESSALVMDMKRELSESGQCHSSQSETPLKLLNLPGCKHRYETSRKILKFDEKCKDAVTDVEEARSDKTKTDLTPDQTKCYFMRQQRGSVHLDGSKKLHSRKRSRKQKETPTPKRKSVNKSSSQSATESKKEPKKPCEKQPPQVVTQSGTSKKAEEDLVSKTITNRNMANQKKSEPAPSEPVPKKSADSDKDNQWESKYFTKASEKFFKMFRESVTSNKVSFDHSKGKMNDRTDGIDRNKIQDANASLPGVLGIQPVLSNINDAPSRVEVAKVNWALPPKIPTKVHSTRELMQQDSKSEQPENNKVKSKNNVENMKRKSKMSNGLKPVKTLEGVSVNKLNMLQSPGSNNGIQTPSEEKRGTENSIFKSKVTGMEKYQIEKNDNVKKELKLNASIDVEKLFEESSTIPFQISSASDGKMWNVTTGTADKGSKHSYSRQQSTLQGITATSDKGKGDAINMIDFNIRKSPVINEQSLKYEVGKTRANNLLEKGSSSCPIAQQSQAPKYTSTVNNGNGWRPPIIHVPISSKTIKQVNPQNYREQIFNYGKKTDDETTRTEKSNKWERILTVFKQIIIRDLEDKGPDFFGSSEAPKNLSKPTVQFGSTMSKVTHAPLRSAVGGNPVPNQKVIKGKISSKVKKKKEILKKKQPAESMRQSIVLKNNPKKIVNYFSKRGNSSSYEKPNLTNFTISSFGQTPDFFNEHFVNIGKHK